MYADNEVRNPAVASVYGLAIASVTSLGAANVPVSEVMPMLSDTGAGASYATYSHRSAGSPPDALWTYSTFV